MADMYSNIDDNPYDANYDFGFLDRYLSSVKNQSSRANRQLASDDDFYNVEDEEDEVGESEEPADEFTESAPVQEEELSFTDNPLFNDDIDNLARQWVMGSGAESPSTSYKPGVMGGSLTDETKSIVDRLSTVVGNVVVTSGKRSVSENIAVGGKSKSFHLTGQAVDLRPSKELDSFLSSKTGREFLADSGYEAIDERNKKGGAHWHLEPVKRQAGGGYKIARTTQEQRIGLNDTRFNSMMLPLKGTNTIRGLDSGQPVEVIDESGSSYVLYGPDDTINVTGPVKEKRLKYKAKYGKA